MTKGEFQYFTSYLREMLINSMSASAQGKNRSILIKSISAFGPKIAQLCSDFIREMPDAAYTNPDIFESYLMNYRHADDRFIRYIHEIGNLGISTPLESIHTVLNYFQRILPDDNEPPRAADQLVVPFTHRLKDIKWEDQKLRSLIFFFTEKITSDIVFEILKGCNDIPKEDFIKISDCVLSLADNTSSSPFWLASIRRSAIEWSKCTRVLSLHIQSELTEKVLQICFNSNKEDPYLDAKLLILSNCTLVTTINDRLIESLNIILNRCTNEVIPRLSKEASLRFLMNMTMQVMENNPSFCSSSTAIRMYETIKKVVESASEDTIAFSLFAYLSKVVSFDQTFNNFEKYLNLFVNPRFSLKELQKSLLSSLSNKLYNFNYCEDIESFLLSGVFSFKNSISKQYLLQLFEWVSLNATSIDAHPVESSRLLIIAICADPELFHDKVLLPIVTNPNNQIKFRVTLLMALRAVLSHGNFAKPVFDKYKECATEIVLNELYSNQPDPTICKSIYSVASVASSLVYLGGSNPQSIKDLAISLPHTSKPLDINVPPPQISTKKWPYGACPEFKQYFRTAVPQEIFTFESPPDPALVAAVSLMPFVNTNPKLIKSAVAAIFTMSSAYGALVMRSLQILVHINPSIASTVINFICEAFKRGTFSYVALFLMIYSVLLIVESARVEGVNLNAEAKENVSLSVFVGICLPIPWLRSELCKICEAGDDFVLGSLLKDNRESISRKAISNALKSVSEYPEELIYNQQFPSFSEIATSHYDYLYLFYISSLGFHLAQTNNKLVLLLISVLQNIVNSTDISPRVAFLRNCLSLLSSLPIHGKFEYHVMQKAAKDVTKKTIQEVAKGSDIILIGIFSSVSLNTLENLLPVFLISEYAARRTAIACLHENIHSLRIVPVIHHIVGLVMRGMISDDIVPRDLAFKVTTSLKPCQDVFIDQFCKVLCKIFSLIFEPHAQQNVVCECVFVDLKGQHPFSTKLWMSVLFNLSSAEDSLFTPTATEALACWMRISKIPSEFLEVLTPKIIEFSDGTPLLLATLLAQYPKKLLPLIIERSAKYFHIFSGLNIILKDIPDVKTLTISDNSIEQLIERNCGSLLASAVCHLYSHSDEERQTALTFILKLSNLVFLIRRDTSCAQKISKSIEKAKELSTSSRSEFIQKGLHVLISTLSEFFTFCSEQFIYEAFIIILQNQTYNMSKSRRLTCLARKNQSSLDISDIPSESISISDTASLIPPWLYNFSFSLKRLGINPLCEPHYQKFSIFTFISMILSIIAENGVIPALAEMIDILRSSSLTTLFLCLFSLRRKFENACMTVILYIYSRSPSSLISIILPFLSVESWFFFESQLSKIDQLFDVSKLFEGISEAKRSTSSSSSFDDESVLDFQEAANYALDMLVAMATDNPEPLELAKSQILFFTYCHKDVYPEVSRKLWCLLTDKVDIPGPNDVASIISLNPFLLKWGLACGDLKIAARALSLFSEYSDPLPEGTEKTLLRAIQIISWAASERSDPSKASVFRNLWQLRVVDEGRKVDFSGVYEYLDAGLKILGTVSRLEHISEFLNCGLPEGTKVFERALSIISKRIQKEGSPPGLIQKILSAQTYSKLSMKFISDIILAIASSGQFDSGLEYVVVLMAAPFLSGKPQDIDCMSKVIKTPTLQASFKEGLLGNNDLFELSLREIGKHITDAHLIQLVSFLSWVAKWGTLIEKEMTYKIGASLLKVFATSDNFLSFSNLADQAVNDQVQGYDVSNRFVASLRLAGFDNVITPTNRGGMLQFQKLTFFPEEEVFRVIEESEKVFDGIATIPPIYVTNINFAVTEVMGKVKRSIDGIKVEPFTGWFETLFLAEVQNTAGLEEYLSNTGDVNIFPHKFITEVEEKREEKKLSNQLFDKALAEDFSERKGTFTLLDVSAFFI